MGPSPTGVAHSTVPGELGELLGSWRRHLRDCGRPARPLPRTPGNADRPADDSPRARRGVHHRPLGTLEAGDSAQPLPGLSCVLPLARRGGRDPRQPDGANEATPAPRRTAARLAAVSYTHLTLP